MNSSRSWVVFASATFAYLIGVTQRSSFGIAGVDATERFGVTAAAISSIAVVQIIVYAALQIPVGILVDRLGPKPLIVGGATLMAIGQLLLAVAPDLGLALVARILLGAGDAVTFVSVIRLLPSWFGGRLLPQLSQWVGTIGQLGQIISAVPFAVLLHSLGWVPAFAILAAASGLAAVVSLLFVSYGTAPPLTGPVPTTGVGPRLRAALRRPGTQLGFWVHMIAGAPTNAIAILWGYPFLTAGLGYPVGEAAAVMALLVVSAFVCGPVIGFLVARFPLRRSNVVITIVIVIFVVWAAVLAWPAQPPFWLVAAFFFVVGAGGPGSLVGFDVARTFNPSHALGSASGIVNVGGFLGGFVSMFLIGIVLDLVDESRVAAGGASDLYALDSFRVAFLVPFVVSAAALVGLLVARRRTRRLMFDEQGIEVAPLWVALFARWRRTRP